MNSLKQWFGMSFMGGMMVFSVLHTNELHAAQKVEKLADFFLTYNSDSGEYGGLGGVTGRFLQVDSNLWFATTRGGSADVGTLSRFNLVTRQLDSPVALTNGITGKTPDTWLLNVSNELYFTTLTGGVGGRGTLAKLSLSNNSVTVLWNFDASTVNGGAPRGGVQRIGDDLYGATSTGGISNRGVVFRYGLGTGAFAVVTNLDGPLLGGQAYAGIGAAASSNVFYFTAQVGGTTFATPGLNLGAGVLDRLSFDDNGVPVVTRVANLLGGFSQFPDAQPLVLSNQVYFTTVGPNTNPGAIVRYDISSGAWSSLVQFNTNASAGNTNGVTYGTRPGYNGLVEWLGELYFINRGGGIYGKGTLTKYNIASNLLVKLADFDGVGAAALGDATGTFDATGTIVQETNRYYIYYPLFQGGANTTSSTSSGFGTIIRASLPPQPLQASLAATDTDHFTLSWTGGYPPFDILTNSDLSVPRANWGVAVSQVSADTNVPVWSVTLPVTGTNLFYSIRGQAE
jgi:uncharacterized repeat protein (TIGR03803 family)